MSTHLQTRFAVARRSKTGAVVDYAFSATELMPMDPSALGVPSAEVLTADPAWGYQLCVSPAFAEPARQLFESLGPGKKGILSLRPLALVFSITEPDHDRIGPQLAQYWLRTMLAALQAAEASPPPPRQLERTGAEKLADNPKKAGKWVLIGLALMLVFFLLMSMSIAFLMVALR